MRLTSLTFLAWFVLVLAVWYAMQPRRRWMAGLGFSLWFYASLDGVGIFAMLGTVLVNWFCGRQMGRLRAKETALSADAPKEAALRKLAFSRHCWLSVGLVQSIGLLLLMRYKDILLPGCGIEIPLGISYYSLMLISYLADVNRGLISAEENPLRLMAYASFFLSVTQGPFNRYGSLMPKMEQECRWNSARIWWGAQRMAWGYFQKLAVADRMAILANSAFNHPERYTGAQLLVGVAAFSLQLYFDFCGYTSIVLGAGEMLGLELPENFRQPYFARNIPDFWRRWHISLSSLLRDYVYIPLGGNRRGKARKYLNLLLTFAVSGLWHGAGLNFLAWGLLHGAYQVVRELLTPLRKGLSTLWPERLKGILRPLQSAGVYLLVGFSFVFFRAESFGAAVHYLSRMAEFRLRDLNLGAITALGVNRMGLLMLLYGTAVIFAVDLMHELGWHLREKLAGCKVPVKLLVWQAALWSMVLLGIFMETGAGSFLYARF